MANTFKFGAGKWAIGDGTALAYNDENDNFKPLPFEFTRASNATVVNKQGLIETVGNGEPRIDFLDNTSGHLLLEPSRTNLMPTSEDFSSADWNRATLTIDSDDAISPYGTSTADKITFTGNGSLRTQNTFTFTNAYTYSIFVKKGNSRYVTLRSFAFTTSVIIGFDLDSVTAQTGGVIKQYPNDWFRLSISKDVSSDADKNGYFYFYLPNSLGSTTSVNGNYAYIFGNQIEEGSYPTSYIPTEGSSVTRSAEVANGAGNSTVFNDSEGVLYAEIAPLADDGTNRHIGISDNTNTNRLQIFFNTHTTTQIRTLNLVSNVKYFDMTSDVTLVNGYGKVAIKYKQNDFALWVNGVEVATDNSGLVWGNGVLDTLKFADGNDASPFYGKVKDLRVYNTALTDTELQNLTS